MFNSIVPKKLEDYIIHKKLAEKLLNFKKNNLTNFIFYGYKFTGKKTLIDSLICSINNVNYLEKYIQKYSLKINNNDVEVLITQSKYHFEINLFEYGLYDKYILSKFVNELASTKNVLNNTSKIIIINRIDKSNVKVQTILKNLLDNNNCNFIITTRNFSKIKNDIKSRCCPIKVPFPNLKEINQYLKINNISRISKEIYNSKLFNLFRVNSLILFSNKSVIKFSNSKIENYINEIISFFNKKNISNSISNIRKILYKIHLLNVPFSDIYNEFIDYAIKNNIFTSFKLNDIIEKAALYQNKSCKLNNIFFCLENFFIYIIEQL